MKRATIRSNFFLAATIFAVAATAFVPAAAFAQQASAPVSRSATEPASSQEPQKASGIVPPGVKLVPEMPAAGAPRPFEFPKSAVKTLPNGLRVFVVTDHREPAVAARLVILSAGSIQDPAGMPGVASMTANLLTQGTAKRSAKEIAETIDFVGGTLEAKAGRDATTVTLDVVKKDLSVGMDLLSDVVLHPSFRGEELDRQRQQLLSDLEVQYSDPNYLATLAFARTLYGSSPYGMPEQGTPATVKKLQREDFVKFHDGNYAPNQAVLGFAGDIAPEDAFAIAEKYFGAWPKLDVAAPTPQAPSNATGTHVWLIDKPDAVQTQIRIGRIAIRRADADFLPLDVTNHIFGGSYNSRLNTEVRIKKGLTYGASSAFTPHRYTGSLAVETYTRTEATVDATKLVMDLLTGMSQGRISQKELDFARDYLAGVYPIETETAEQVTDRVLTVAAFDLPRRFQSDLPGENPRHFAGRSAGDGAKIFHHQRPGYRAGWERRRISRRAEKRIYRRGIYRDSFRSGERALAHAASVTAIRFRRTRPCRYAGIARTGQANPVGRRAGCWWRCAAVRRDLGFQRERDSAQSAWRPAARRDLESCLSGPFVWRSNLGPHND